MACTARRYSLSMPLFYLRLKYKIRHDHGDAAADKQHRKGLQQVQSNGCTASWGGEGIEKSCSSMNGWRALGPKCTQTNRLGLATMSVCGNLPMVHGDCKSQAKPLHEGTAQRQSDMLEYKQAVTQAVYATQKAWSAHSRRHGAHSIRPRQAHSGLTGSTTYVAIERQTKM